MSLKNQTSTSGIPYLFLALILVALAIAGGIWGLAIWMMVVSAIVAVVIVLLLAMRRDISRYLRIRDM